MIASPVTRIPLWRGNPENIVGILHVKDLLRALHAVDGDAAKVDIAALLTPPWFVPDTRPVSEQLKAFRRRKTPFALVVDEYGEVEGLVTLEDILEEIVGDITDEHDVAMPGVRRQPDGSVNVDGAVPIRDLNRVMDWNLPDEEATTIAGLVIHEARSIPEVGQSFTFHGFRFRVLRRERNRITALRIQPLPRKATAKAELDAASPGAAAWMASACTPPASSPAKVCVDQAVALEPGLSFERFRHDIDAEMGLPARPGPAWPSCWCDSSTTLRLCGLKASVNFFVMRSAVRMPIRNAGHDVAAQCQVLKLSRAKAHNVRS